MVGYEATCGCGGRGCGGGEVARPWTATCTAQAGAPRTLGDACKDEHWREDLNQWKGQRSDTVLVANEVRGQGGATYDVCTLAGKFCADCCAKLEHHVDVKG